MKEIIIKSVFFDLDGTLIDTEKYYKRCWPLAFKYYGYDVKEEQFLTLRSLGKPFANERMQMWFGKDIPCDDIRNKVRELTYALIEKEGLTLKKGVINTLNFLKDKKVKIAVVTATNKDRTIKCLQETKIIDYFDDIVSATEVNRGKPAPDVYIYAANKVGVNLRECIVVEDSPNGANSGISAGAKVIMVPDLTKPDDKLKNELFAILDSLDDFADFITNNNIILQN